MAAMKRSVSRSDRRRLASNDCRRASDARSGSRALKPASRTARATSLRVCRRRRASRAIRFSSATGTRSARTVESVLGRAIYRTTGYSTGEAVGERITAVRRGSDDALQQDPLGGPDESEDRDEERSRLHDEASVREVIALPIDQRDEGDRDHRQLGGLDAHVERDERGQER